MAWVKVRVAQALSGRRTRIGQRADGLAAGPRPLPSLAAGERGRENRPGVSRRQTRDDGLGLGAQPDSRALKGSVRQTSPPLPSPTRGGRVDEAPPRVRGVGGGEATEGRTRGV